MNTPDCLGHVRPNGAMIPDLFYLPPIETGWRWTGKVIEWNQMFDGMGPMHVEARVRFYQEKEPEAEYIEICPTCLK